MTFISILIALVIERFFHWAHLRNWRWFDRYESWLNQYSSKLPSYVALIASVLPILLVVGLIDWLLTGWLYGLLKLIFGVLVLLYCFGPNNLWQQVYTCIAALNNPDSKIAIDCVQTAFRIDVPNNSQAFHKVFARAIFIKGYHHVFAIIFWFALLGPVGAVLYRVLTRCAEKSLLNITAVAQQTLQILDWIPVRIFTFLFALGGHFTAVFAIWKKSFKQGLDATEALVGNSGLAALDLNVNQIPEDGSAEKEALDLLDRVYVMSLVVLAIIVLLI